MPLPVVSGGFLQTSGADLVIIISEQWGSIIKNRFLTVEFDDDGLGGFAAIGPPMMAADASFGGG
ncbi:MAG: hypothetical protein R3B46_14340 [Phycisphaerales bacterium]